MAVLKQRRFICASCYGNLVPCGVKLGKAVSLGVGAFKAWSLITSMHDCQGVTEVPGLWFVQNTKSIKPEAWTQLHNFANNI